MRKYIYIILLVFGLILLPRGVYAIDFVPTVGRQTYGDSSTTGKTANRTLYNNSNNLQYYNNVPSNTWILGSEYVVAVDIPTTESDTITGTAYIPVGISYDTAPQVYNRLTASDFHIGIGSNFYTYGQNFSILSFRSTCDDSQVERTLKIEKF